MGVRASYPEMDKIVALCNIFHCDMNVLINKDITEERERKDATGIVKNLFQSAANYVKKTIYLFEHKSFKDIVKLLAQVIIIICVILCFSIPFMLLKEIVISLFYTGNNWFSMFFSKFWEFIFNAGYAVLAIATFLYIFKIKFLDGEEVVEIIEEEEVPSKEEKDTGKQPEQKQKVKVVKVKSNDFNLLDLLSKAITICLKGIFLLFLIPIVIGTIFAIVVFVLLIAVMFQGVFLFGPILLLIGIIVFRLS